MLRVEFITGGLTYALPARDVVEVLPRVALRTVQAAPPGVVGLFTYRGTVVPVVDTAFLLGGAPCPELLGNRILVIRLSRSDGSARDTGGADRLVGVLVEGVLGVASDAVTEQRSLDLRAAPWLGPVYASPAGLVQLFVAGEVLPGAVIDALLGSETP